MDPSSHPPSDPDSLVGSPELFATNLLIVRAIEHEIEAVEISREDAAITVQLLAEDRSFEQEVLTEDRHHWDSIRDRFQSLTDPTDDPDRRDRFRPRTPATESVDRIEVEYPDPSTIKLYFHFPDS